MSGSGGGYPSDLADEQWALVEPLLPAARSGPKGGRREKHPRRRIVDAIFYVVRTGCAWRQLPKDFPPWPTVYWYFTWWHDDGTAEQVHDTLRGRVRKADGRNAEPSAGLIDSQSQRAAGARKRGPAERSEPRDHALGRSRGGLSTKVHLASDSRARPLALHVTAGQAGDALAFEAVMGRIRVPRKGLGRPRTRPASSSRTGRPSSRAIRAHLRRRGIRAVIPQPADPIGHRLRRGRAGGRPPGFDAETYKERNSVERCIARLKQWRGPAMRTDKLALAYQAALHLAAILIWTSG
ncbi:IS5 family transposase [Streptomyces sp. NPDC005808]|uniref:IS5 family transposase n=1 Tax=Streptomyces sp. NPDC005808 TaxID=3364734 RepID=UPI0036901F90